MDIEFDDAASVTGDPEDNFIYTVKLDTGEIPDIHFRRHDLKKNMKESHDTNDHGDA